MRSKIVNLSTIILWALIGVCITVFFSFGAWLPWFRTDIKDVPQLIFPAIELVVLAVSGGLSTSFFYLTHYNLRKQLGFEDEEINFILWGGIRSIFLFVLAIYSVEHVEPFLFVVVLIYANFCRVNAKQAALILDRVPEGGRSRLKPRFQSAIDTMIWLREENGIAVLALTSVALVVVILTASHIILGHEIQATQTEDQKAFYSQMKAFIVGAAILHVVASMIKHIYKFLKEDVVDQSLELIEENLAAMQPEEGGVDELRIWTISDTTAMEFSRTLQRWRWIVRTLVLLSLIFCGTSLYLNAYYHHPLPARPAEASSEQDRL